MFKNYRLFTVAWLAALCSGGTAALAGQPQQFPIDENFFNPCTGEFIALKGKETVQMPTTRIDNGIAHMQFHYNAKADGVGANTRAKYQLGENQNGESNVKLTQGTGEFNQVIRGRIIALGNDLPDTIRKETFHITVNANGSTTVSRSDVSIECK